MDVDPKSQPSHPASSSSSSSSLPAVTKEPVKKFKLDPMSLLLPHERQLYSNSAPPSIPGSGFGQPQGAGAGLQGFSQQAQANQSLAGRVGASGSRQTSSHGDQSGQRGITPGKWTSRARRVHSCTVTRDSVTYRLQISRSPLPAALEPHIQQLFSICSRLEHTCRRTIATSLTVDRTWQRHDATVGCPFSPTHTWHASSKWQTQTGGLGDRRDFGYRNVWTSFASPPTPKLPNSRISPNIPTLVSGSRPIIASSPIDRSCRWAIAPLCNEGLAQVRDRSTQAGRAYQFGTGDLGTYTTSLYC
jgi:hypothetical protein